MIMLSVSGLSFLAQKSAEKVAKFCGKNFGS
jgi:hypothetical protein